VYNPPNATPIIVDKISEEEYVKQTQRLRDKRQTLQVKHAYRLRGDSKRALKVCGPAERLNARPEAGLRGRHPICLRDQLSFLPSHQTLITCSSKSTCVYECVFEGAGLRRGCRHAGMQYVCM